MSRHKRDGNIDGRTARAIRLLLNRHAVREYQVIDLYDSVVIRSQDLLDNYPLRAFDSVQLATAIEINNRLSAAGKPFLTMVAADTRLLTAAAAEGLQTHNPK